MSRSATVLLFGRRFTRGELDQIRETVRLFPRLSRHELARTVCEHLGWIAPNGRYKVAGCLQLLERMEAAGQITLPPRRKQRPRGKEQAPRLTARTAPPVPIIGKLEAFQPVALQAVNSLAGVRLWNEYVQRDHPLGYRRPFGAHQRYFILADHGRLHLGCILMAASAWAVAARDAWIGWTPADRHQRLSLIVNQSRLLVFSWVRIPNLASHALGMLARRIRTDWRARYGYAPVLLETFVDLARHAGTCYRAANWIELGETTGRGRMDRFHQAALGRKRIFVYPLVPAFREILRGEQPVAEGSGEAGGEVEADG